MGKGLRMGRILTSSSWLISVRPLGVTKLKKFFLWERSGHDTRSLCMPYRDSSRYT